jgi:RNA polymerase sigma-70 factor, ECF subfamily
MPHSGHGATRGLEALREAVVRALLGGPPPAVATAGSTPRRTPSPAPHPLGWVFSETVAGKDVSVPDRPQNRDQGFDDADQAASSEETEEERTRLIALVELARKGDSDAFGMLYDHYQRSVYRFLFYRTRSSTLAEDLTSETFFRALRNMQNFRWQGKDFGAWLMTIARNLATDHFKAGRTRLEMTTEDMGLHDDSTEGPENAVLASLTNELLLKALTELPSEQKDCLIMRFLQGMSIAETAGVLGRSEGAVKQLQLRGVRNLAKLMPEGIRG